MRKELFRIKGRNSTDRALNSIGKTGIDFHCDYFDLTEETKAQARSLAFNDIVGRMHMILICLRANIQYDIFSIAKCRCST